MRKFRTIVLYVLFGLALFCTLLGAFTQTQIFRDRLRAIAIARFDSLLNAEVHLGTLRGNLVTGLSLDSIRITVDGRPLLRLGRLELAYNLLSLPGKTISLQGCTLVHPEIFLYRPASGPWNISQMIRRHPEDTTKAGPLDWTIALGHLEIQDGTIALLDSLSLGAPDHLRPDGQTVEYHAFSVRDVNLVASARVNDEQKHVVIDSCSFVADAPDIRLKNLHGSFTVGPSEARVDSLRIITSRTDLLLNASMKEIDLLNGIDLRSLQFAPVELSLHTRPVDLDELKEFLPPIDFLTGSVSTELIAHGHFGNLKVQQFDVRVGSSMLFLRGVVTNLHDPGKLMLDVKLTESTIVPADIPALMPRFDIPDFSQAGTATLNLEFEGRPADFRTKFLLEAPAGKIQSSGFALTIGGPASLAYDGTVAVQNLDLKRVLDDDRMASRLNGTARMQGVGVQLPQLVSSLVLQIDSSEFRGLPVENTRLIINADRRLISARGDLSLGDMRARLQGELEEQEGRLPTFRIEGDVSSLNLEPILHDSMYNSDITMKLSAVGEGLAWNTINGRVVFDLTSSRYRDYHVTEGDFHFTIDQKDSLNKKVQFESNIADLTLTGAFDPGYLIKLLSFEIRNVRAAIGEKITVIDSSLALSVDRKALEATRQVLAATPRYVNARYDLHVKDLEPFSVAAGERTFNGSGRLTGTIIGGLDDLSIGGELAVNDFFYGHADAGILVEDGTLSLDVRSLTPVEPLKKLAMHLETTAGKVLVNRNSLDSLGLTFDYRNEKAEYGLQTSFNQSAGLQSAGNARIDENSMTVDVQKLGLGYQDFRWHADPGAVLRVNHVSAALNGLVLRRDSQTLSVGATISHGHTIAASIDGTHLDLDGLKYLLADEELGPQGKAFAGEATLHASASGSLADPVVTASLTGENISFRTLPFGRLKGDFRYGDQELVSHVRVLALQDSADASSMLTIDGTLPVDLRLGGRGGGDLNRLMNLRIISRGTQMNVLDPLLPTFNQLTGVMTCNLTLGGSFRHPTYEGIIGLTQCGFLFVPNNIYYTLEGSFQATGERINVGECIVKNVPEDQRSGREGMVRLGGDFSLHNLKPGDFNLTAEGKLLVVKETTRKSSLEVYGDLFVEIGPGPLRFTGEVKNSLLKGSLLVRNSSLVFPPTQTVLAEESARSVPVVLIDDTLKTRSRQGRNAEARYFGERQSALATAADVELKRSKSFMDGLHYDLDIETGGGNTEIRMIFNPATSEELVATLEGKFTIAEDGKRWTGDLTVERAYYNFFKRFDATGNIRYTGDFMNPELNIRAKYKGMRTLTDSTSVGRQEPVVVTVKITGTRYEPKIEFTMTIDDIDYLTYRGPKSNDVQSDAISFIVAGTFPLTTTQKNDLASEVRATAGLSLLTGATSLLTGRLSEFLRTQTGFINTVELSYGGRESTELRLSGTAWNGYWRYGGTILNDPLSNANISILYSLGTIFDNPSLRNLMFELERRVEPGTLGQANDLKRINSARLFYRFSF